MRYFHKCYQCFECNSLSTNNLSYFLADFEYLLGCLFPITFWSYSSFLRFKNFFKYIYSQSLGGQCKEISAQHSIAEAWFMVTLLVCIWLFRMPVPSQVTIKLSRKKQTCFTVIFMSPRTEAAQALIEYYTVYCINNRMAHCCDTFCT